ncbi:hypothetical protein RJ639_030621 [Escallonia herrerae]|uniref:Zinc knuckle CX2CX4HX4C domain-containing protein n=1 Tax=Escallonia herrerae TaxID=1293975 RepID=A0AA88X0I8_9ASTE|nr:hypothetical protein RJ639_030621 [Escallonia herrerae]
MEDYIWSKLEKIKLTEEDEEEVSMEGENDDKCFSEKSARVLGAKIGDVLKVTKPLADINSERFLRVRVRCPISKPLKRGGFIRYSGGEGKLWIEYKYERISSICYYCSCLDHNVKDCDVKLEDEHYGKTIEYQYGEWKLVHTSKYRYKVMNGGFCKSAKMPNHSDEWRPVSGKEHIPDSVEQVASSNNKDSN